MAAVSADAREPEAGDAGVAVRKAQDAIDRAIRVGGLTGDPLVHVLQVQSAVLGAMHQLYLDGATTLARQIADVPHPVTVQDLQTESAAQVSEIERKITTTLRQSGQQIARACLIGVDRRAGMIVAVGLLIAALFGGAVDHFLIGQSAWRPPAACWSQGSKTFCQPGVWLGDRP